MALLSVMRESLELLYKEPKIFLPNMTVAVFYAVFELILLKMSIDLFGNPGTLSQEEIRSMMSSNIILLLAILAFYPFLAALDLISYAMYPSMVSDHFKGKDISLGRAVSSALKAWRIWVSIGLVIAIFVVCVTPVVSAFYILYYMTQNYIYFLLGALIFFAAIVLLMLSIFFVMPIGIIDKEGTLSSFKKSHQLGRQNKKGVIFIVFLSFAVMATAFIVGSNQAISSNSGLTVLAVLAFMLIKMLQSTMYTYVSVINPNFYLQIKGDAHHKHAGNKSHSPH